MPPKLAIANEETSKTPARRAKKRAPTTELVIGNDEPSSSIVFTMSEKRKFLEALKTQGFNIIYDLNALSRYLPNRSTAELKFLIDIYKKRGREARDDDDNSVTRPQPPIEAWYSIVHHLVPAPAKKDDVSTLFSQIFEEYAEQQETQPSIESSDEPSTTESLKPNFAAIYHYLAETLAGKYPPELTPADSLVVLSLVENLKNIVAKHSSSFEEVEKFAEAAAWWKNESDGERDALTLRCSLQESGLTESLNLSASHSSSPGNEQDEEPAANSTSNETSPSHESSSTAIATLPAKYRSITEKSARTFIETCLNFPKIKKLKSCLNPLDVPVELLIKHRSLLKTITTSSPPSQDASVARR